MRSHGCLSLCIEVLFVVEAAAQFSNWQPHQINTSICYWKQPRAALIRDTVYLDGGSIWWSPGLDSGELGPVVDDGNYQGVILTYNLTQPFSPGSNITGMLLQYEMSKAWGGKGNGISAEPNSYDGGMLANDAEFFLYGGVVFSNDDLYDAPAANAVLEYQAYPYGVDKPLWQKGFRQVRLDGVTPYIAYGGAVSAPSEKKAWYFSGLTSPSRGPIMFNAGLNTSVRAVNISNTLISLDMTTQLKERWENTTLPDDIRGRSAEVVWVPAGKQGIIVVLGGVTYPEWASASHKSENAIASQRESPEFMRVIDMYDIAGNKWYKQPTQDGPGTRSRGCAVVAPAADHSSFNIYYYGGFDGIHPKAHFYDDVWVLSLPSFTWTQINKGTAIHGRSGHKRFLPYPDQMMVFGGYTPESGNVPSCLEKGPVVVFNITSGEWMDSYDPTKYGGYGVHERVRAVIGGDVSGRATVTTPVPSGWATSALADVFAQTYDTKKITTYWPYGTAAATGQPDLPDDSGEAGGDKKYIIIPAVVVPLVALFGLVVVAWRCCLNRKSVSNDSGSDEAVMRIMSWIRSQAAEKSITATSSEALSQSPEMAKIASFAPVPCEPVSSVHHEMADTQLAELGDTSPPAELHDTGLSPVEMIQKHSNKIRSPTDPSQCSTCGLGDTTSFVSRTSGAANSIRVDSPLLGNNTPLNEIPRPVAADAAGSALWEHMPPMLEDHSQPLSPTSVSPPVAGEFARSDHLSAIGTSGTTTERASRENERHMGRQ